jgi:hypothetical protein
MEYNWSEPMGKLRLAATAAALTVAAFAAPAFAQVSSAADCEYEGGEVFNVQGATVCLVQIRPEEYRDNEVYDGQQLGVSQCSGDTLSNGTFCKITLVPAPAKPEVEAVETVVEDAEEMMDDKSN